MYPNVWFGALGAPGANCAWFAASLMARCCRTCTCGSTKPETASSVVTRKRNLEKHMESDGRNDGKWWKMMENDGKWWKMMEDNLEKHIPHRDPPRPTATPARTSRRCVSRRFSKALRCQAPKMRSLGKGRDGCFMVEISWDIYRYIYIYIYYIHNIL
jgi:hypothetical protein